MQFKDERARPSKGDVSREASSLRRSREERNSLRSEVAAKSLAEVMEGALSPGQRVPGTHLRKMMVQGKDSLRERGRSADRFVQDGRESSFVRTDEPPGAEGSVRRHTK